MDILKARLIKRIIRTPTIESFRFYPEKRIDFLPGQFLQLIFDTSNWENKELNKYLSFCSAPLKDYIEVTKRLSESSFSQKLRSLKTDDEISLKAPMGNRVFKEEYQKIGFLIGGIGITPVISIIEYIVERKSPTDCLLFYSNRSEEEIAFKGELDGWRNKNNNIKIVYTVTDSKPKDSTCISGRITKELVIQNLKDISERLFFIFGPPKMVEAMNALCLEIGCSKEKIKTESFIGY